MEMISQMVRWLVMNSESRMESRRFTSELQAPQLERDQPVADLDEVDECVEVVGSQNETVSGAVVAPSAQHEVATK